MGPDTITIDRLIDILNSTCGGACLFSAGAEICVVGPDTITIDRLIAILNSMCGGTWLFLVGRVSCAVGSDIIIICRMTFVLPRGIPGEGSDWRAHLLSGVEPLCHGFWISCRQIQIWLDITNSQSDP